MRQPSRPVHAQLTTNALVLAIVRQRHSATGGLLERLGIGQAQVTAALRLPARAADRQRELSDDVTEVRKDNDALRAAVADMRPVFDAAVRHAAQSGEPSQPARAVQLTARIQAGEFGEPRRLT